jgi:HAD superfamily hydrolase (TIGR01484 family)
MKSLIVFDLDGTLAESKSPMDAEMAGLITGLLGVTGVAVISGGGWAQFESQLLPALPTGVLLDHLTLLPICGAEFYVRQDGWTRIYSQAFTPAERDQIRADLEAALRHCAFDIPRIWGPQIEDRGGQVTLSALGQAAPIAEKLKWDPDQKKRTRILEQLAPQAALYSAHIGGATSVDVTRPGIDKAFGIRQLASTLKIDAADMLFVGDALFAGGNDFPVKTTGVATIAVRDAEETKRVIETLIACRHGIGRAGPRVADPAAVPSAAAARQFAPTPS